MDHLAHGRKKRDYLTFRLELPEELIGGFSSQKRAGRRRSDESRQLSMLSLQIRHLPFWHLPVQVEQKLECVVCIKKRSKLGLRRSELRRSELRRSELRHELRHESRIISSICKVHLCVHTERNCFENYHTLVEYWH